MKTFSLLLITLFILQSCIQSNQPPEPPKLPNLPYQKNYHNLDKFGKIICSLHDTLGKKYHIKDYAFDVECIYAKEDLSKLVWEMCKPSLNDKTAKKITPLTQQEYLTKAEAAFGMRK